MVNVAVLFASTACAAQDVLHGSRWEHSDEADEYLCFRIDAMVLRAEIPARTLLRGRPWREAHPPRDQRTRRTRSDEERVAEERVAEERVAEERVAMMHAIGHALLNFAASPTSIFDPASTPADSVFDLSMFVLAVATGIFATVFGLLVYAVVQFRREKNDDGTEPPQVYGSNEVELAWTIVPVLIVVALFLATARVIAAVQHPPKPPGALDVVVVGHQYWWEYRYPASGVVTANELHVPVSDPAHPTPTFLTLLSADTDHSFWVPRLAGKTDLIPNHPNSMWIDPHETGLYLGQCAQYCGTQHAKMLLRVYVDSHEDFDRWIESQRRPAQVTDAAARGRQVFESTSCVNCHAVRGTPAAGGFGPDLTHFMSRETLASGAAPNTPENLRLWIRNPDALKPGSRMPAMQLSDDDVNAVAAYLESLH